MGFQLWNQRTQTKKIEIINIKMSTVVILSGKIRNFLGYSVLFKPSLTSWTALTSERKK